MSQIDELRELLVGNDSQLLHELIERIENVEQRARDVAEVLPAAIDERVSADEQLVDALKEPVSLGLKKAIRNEPDAYAEILYPVMAPSIRRAIAQALSSMMTTINKTIEAATSAQSIRYRIESWRTGVPHAELMLRRSAKYKVEHVYLIDRDTGFSRLTDFKSEQQSEKHSTWIVHGSSMMLACVILGDAPERLRNKLYDTLDGIHVDFANESAAFDGDSSIFGDVNQHIDPLVELNDKTLAEEKSGIIKVMFPILFFLAFVALCLYAFDRYSTTSTVEHFMQETPGIAVTSVYWDEDQVVVEGLQDPDALIPYDILNEEGIPEDVIRMQTIPFRSLEYSMELQRFKSEFQLPSGLQFGGGDGRITLSGEAPFSWLQENELRLRQLSADHRLDISALSASLRSVNAFLIENFDRSVVLNMSSNIIALNDRTVVKLSGRLSEGASSRLSELFFNNYWVDVGAPAKW